jgi:lysine 2,3-aminomutase
MYCRHCTRKNTLEEMTPGENIDFDAALEYIAEHPQVREVLISGGDPLLLNTERLDRLLGRIQAIEHIEVVRIGTRVPVVLPMRIDNELSAMLSSHKPLWINTQFNHPRELTKEALTACRRLTDAGIPVSNQSVLLKGINDDFETMRALCAKLQRNLIRPYYVFQCDPIIGISHFRTDIRNGVELEKKLRESIGGLALPRFVADHPGEKSKITLK